MIDNSELIVTTLRKVEIMKSTLCFSLLCSPRPYEKIPKKGGRSRSWYSQPSAASYPIVSAGHADVGGSLQGTTTPTSLVDGPQLMIYSSGKKMERPLQNYEFL